MNLLWLTVTALAILKMAPLSPWPPPLPPRAWFWVNRQWVAVRIAPDTLAMAPPRPAAPGVPTAWLLDRTTRARDRVPPVFRMPPPSPGAPTAIPSVIVSPAMVTVAPPLILKIRLRWLPLTARRQAPGPRISTSSVMSSGPLDITDDVEIRGPGG